MTFILRTSAFLSVACMAAITLAQLPTVDITSHTTVNDQVEIYIRPDGPFDEVFSSSVFTLRWLNADGANLGSVQQVVPEVQYQSVTKSGPEQVDGAFRYQIFTGFGLITLMDLETSWAANEEVLLCRVNVINGSSWFELVNDDWTQSNNASYYISLNGEDRTGQIYSFTTVAEEGIETDGRDVRIMPNPGTGPFQVWMDGMGEGRLEMYITDGMGRNIWSHTTGLGKGTVREEIDLSGRADGVYLLTLRSMSGTSTHRIILNRD